MIYLRFLHHVHAGLASLLKVEKKEAEITVTKQTTPGFKAKPTSRDFFEKNRE